MEDKNKNIPFLGTGWSFPPEFDNISGSVVMSSGEQDIHESLQILLSTSIQERIMKPEFGCDLSPLMFDGLTGTTLRIVADRIKKAILLFEPRIKIEDVTVNNLNNEGYLEINIDYIVRSTNTRSNMVYPYYIIEGTNL